MKPEPGHQISHGSGNEHLTGLSQRYDPRSDVHREPGEAGEAGTGQLKFTW